MPPKRRSPVKPPLKLPPKPPPSKSNTFPPPSSSSPPPAKSDVPIPSDLKTTAPASASSGPINDTVPLGATPSSEIVPQDPKGTSKDSSCPDPGSKSLVLEPADPSSEDSAQTLPKPLWVDLLKGSRSMKKKGEPFLLESGELCVQIPDEVITQNSKRWESFIIGQFHGNLPSRGALHGIFNGIWSNRLRDITISRLGTRTVLIRIPNPITRQRVLGQGM